MPLGCFQGQLLLDRTQHSGAAVINPMFLFNEVMLLGFCPTAGEADRAELRSQLQHIENVLENEDSLVLYVDLKGGKL